MMAPMTAQLPLSLNLPFSASLADFIAFDNQAALCFCQNLAKPNTKHQERQLYLWGQAGAGKSHLLQATVAAARACGQSCLYLGFEHIGSYAPAILTGDFDLLALDDVALLADSVDWQEALMHAINRARARGGKLLLAGNAPPEQLPLGLADLKSRLAWGAVLKLQPLDDAAKLQWLQQRARAAGLELGQAAGQYLLNHCQRDMASLERIFAALNRASLAQMRKLTVPLIKEVLAATP